MNLKNKTALITGASGGIGYALSEKLTEEKCKVICFDIKKPEIPVKKVIYYKVDVSNEKQISSALKKVNGKIDILINNAGIMRRGNLFESSVSDFDMLFNVNLKSYWLMIKLTKNKMSKKPIVVFNASRHALFLKKDPALYTLTKKATITLAKITKLSCPNYNIKILCPGSTDTNLTKVGLTKKQIQKKKSIMISPKDLAEKIIALLKSKRTWLIYDEKSKKYITK